VTYDKRGERRTVPIRFVEAEQFEVVTLEAAGEAVPPAARALRDAWLGSRLDERR
jgi:hypothetical protein